MTNIICNECETVAHCMNNGCVPKQPAYRAVKTYHEGKPVYVAEQPAQKRPQNCGTGYCSCIECVMEPAQPIIKSYPEKDNSAQPLVVPDALTAQDPETLEYILGWNDCRQLMMEMIRKEIK